MDHIHGIIVALLLALSVVSYHAAWVCHRRPESAGIRGSGALGFVAVTVLLGSICFLMMWIHSAASEGVVAVLKRAGVSIVVILLQFPFVTYHIGDYFARKVTGQSLPDSDPRDDFSRAMAIEERGDARGAIELYSIITKNDPLRTDARIRLAELLAGSRRAAQAQDVVRSVLTRDDLPAADRAELSALLLKWEDRGLYATPPRGPGHQARQVTTVRMEAHEQEKANSADADPDVPV